MVSACLTYFSSRFSVVLKTSKVRPGISNDLAEETVALSVLGFEKLASVFF